MDPWGSNTPLLYIVGEAPGRTEDEYGMPFIGRSGKLLRKTLRDLGIPDEAIRINNSCRCAPFREKKQKIEKPNKKEWTACMPSVFADILATKPKVVLALGGVAKTALLHTSVKITQIRGTVQKLTIEGHTFHCVPTFHPSFLQRKQMKQDLLVQWLRDLKSAWNLATSNTTVVEHPKDYRILNSVQEITAYIAFLGEQVRAGTVPYVVTDVEASALDPHPEENELLLLGISHRPHQSCIVPIDHYESPLRGQRREVAEALRPLGSLPLANQNIKMDYQWFRKKLGIAFSDIRFDTMLGHHCIHQSTRANDLESLGAIYLNEPAWSWRVSEIVKERRDSLARELRAAKKQYKVEYKKGQVSAETQAAVENIGAWHRAANNGAGYAVVPMQDLAWYCCIDCDVTWRLVPIIVNMLREANLEEVFQRMYMQNLLPWADIQFDGIPVDARAIERHCIEFPKKIDKIRDEFNSIPLVKKTATLIGKETVNINSPPQVATLLYDVMKSPAPKDKRKSKRSTEAEVLKVLLGSAKRRKGKTAAQVLQCIQDFRSTTKNFSSYIKGPATFMAGGLIHPSWNIAGTDTGRASASDPPIHSQPKDIRDIVYSRYEDIGGCILSFDQSQIEVRVFASLARDPFLIETYNQAGADVHRMLASMLFGIPPEEVTTEQRSIAKTCVFASLYGGGPGRIAGQTGMALPEAKAVHARFTSIIRLNEFRDEMWSQLMNYGHIYTAFGRIRVIPVPDDESRVYHAKNQCINTPIQSAASDITEESITRLWWRMKQAGMQSKIILWHHDAIVWDVYPGELPTLVAMAHQAMVEEPMQMYQSWLRVPLKIDGGFGTNWRDQLEIVAQDGNLYSVEGEKKAYDKILSVPFGRMYPSQVSKEWTDTKTQKQMVQATFRVAA